MVCRSSGHASRRARCPGRAYQRSSASGAFDAVVYSRRRTYDTTMPPWCSLKRHLRAIEDLYDRGGPAISVTEARATGILLNGAGLLVHLYTLGPVHCLGAPGIEPPPPPSPDDPVSVALSDGSIWDMSGLNAGLVALLMMYLTNDEFTADSGLVFPSLEIDIRSRRAAKNRLDIDARKIAEHRKINKGLAMELLTSLMLAGLDTAREVRCNCEARNGLPHKFAPAGVTDVEAFYDKPPPGFLVIAAVSAKSDVTPEFYREQLDQALEHAEALTATTDVPVYWQRMGHPGRSPAHVGQATAGGCVRRWAHEFRRRRFAASRSGQAHRAYGTVGQVLRRLPQAVERRA